MAKQNIASAFGANADAIAFDAVGTDRAAVSGFTGPRFEAGKKYDLERALSDAFSGNPKCDIGETGQLKSITFSHGDIDGNIHSLATVGRDDLADLKNKVSASQQGQSRGGAPSL